MALYYVSGYKAGPAKKQGAGKQSAGVGGKTVAICYALANQSVVNKCPQRCNLKLVPLFSNFASNLLHARYN